MNDQIKMEHCPKFHHCSAPLCPLDPDWIKRKMLQGDNLCHYLCEASKDGTMERFKRRYDKPVLMRAFGLSEEMRKYSKALDRGLERAANTPSVIPTVQLDLDLD
jgi:hypothetical protein